MTTPYRTIWTAEIDPHLIEDWIEDFGTEPLCESCDRILAADEERWCEACRENLGDETDTHEEPIR